MMAQDQVILIFTELNETPTTSYWHVKNRVELRYKLIINRRKEIEIKELKNSQAIIDYLQIIG